MSLDLSDTQVLYPKPVVAPQAGYKFMQPWYEDYQRRLGASVFGAPGQYGGLMDQPQPIPLEGTAGLTPMQMMARQGVMGAGPYEPAYGTASQLMGEAAGGYRGSTGAFNPYTMTSHYYNPYETDVVEDTLERMRRQSAQQDIAARAQDISSGAFGGSRGRLLAGERQAESERGILGALAGIRGQGFQRAQEAAMNDYARRMSMLSGAAGGLGGIAGQVLGMGGQRQGEMMNWLNMMNQYGGQGRDIYQQGLSRLYQSALRRAQEPWERIMRGQALLAGMKPGQLVGGYETKLATPDTWQDPTGLGSLVSGAGGLGSIISTGRTIWDILSGKDPDDIWYPGNAQGGYIQKPKKYNDGGIVSGLVPIQMQDGGDSSLDIPDFILEAGDAAIQNYLLADQMINSGEARQVAEGGKMMTQLMQVYGPSLMETIEDPAREKLAGMGVSPGGIEALLMGGTALELIGGKGRGVIKAGGKGRLGTWKQILEKKLRDAADKANKRKRRRKAPVSDGQSSPTTPLLTGPGGAGAAGTSGAGTGGAGTGGAGGPSIGSRAWELIKKHKGKILPAAVVGSIGYNILGEDDEATTVPPKDKKDVTALISVLEAQKARHEKAKSKAEKDEIWKDIIKTTGRLSDMMHAPGRRQTTIGDLGRILAEERMDIGEEDADVRRLEALSEMMGGEFSPAQLWKAEETGLPPASGYDRTILVRSIMEDMFPDLGRARTMEEQQQMIAVENELLTRNVNELLDLIEQGYGVLPDPRTSSLLGGYAGEGGPITQPKISINAAQGMTDEYDVQKAIRTGGAD